MLRTLFSATILAGALAPAGDSLAGRSVAGNAMAQAPDAGCALPSEPEGIPAALDAAITGPADKDRACMKALLIPEARMMFVSLVMRVNRRYRNFESSPNACVIRRLEPCE